MDLGYVVAIGVLLADSIVTIAVALKLRGWAEQAVAQAANDVVANFGKAVMEASLANANSNGHGKIEQLTKINESR